MILSCNKMELNSNLNWRVNERYHGNWVKKTKQKKNLKVEKIRQMIKIKKNIKTPKMHTNKNKNHLKTYKTSLERIR